MAGAQHDGRDDERDGAASALERLVGALADPDAWSGSPAATAGGDAAPERIDTHGAVLLLGPRRVLKIRRAVDLGFLDFSTLERRRRFCDEEVRLNRRLAAWMYLGVRAIVEIDDGVRTIDAAEYDAMPDADRPRLLEWAVEMHRLPAEGMLDARLERGDVAGEDVDRLARTIADFHADARRSAEIDAWSAPDQVAASQRRNLDQCRAYAGAALAAADAPDPAGSAGTGAVTIEAALLDRLERWVEREGRRRTDLVAERVRAGCACEGHGDLHAGNVCFVDDPPDGPPDGSGDGPVIAIYDAIEFDPRLRAHDVAEDLAFLGMDLDRRGRPDLADRLVAAYAAAAPPACAAGLDLLQPLHRAHFAAVRAKVTSIRAADPAVAADERRRTRDEAERLFLHAAGHATGHAGATPPALVVLCGLPGTGKSTIAALLAGVLRAEVVSSDRVRKALAGVAPDAPAGPDAYTPAMSDRTYAAVRERAEAMLRAGRSAILDANHPSPERRGPALELARAHGAAAALLLVTGDDELVEARLAERAERGDRTGASDADVEVRRRLRRRFVPPDEVDRGLVVRAAAADRPVAAASAVLRRLLDAATAG